MDSAGLATEEAVLLPKNPLPATQRTGHIHGVVYSSKRHVEACLKCNLLLLLHGSEGAEVPPVLRPPMRHCSSCTSTPGNLLCKLSSNSNVIHLGVLPLTEKQEPVFSKLMGAAFFTQVSLLPLDRGPPIL